MSESNPYQPPAESAVKASRTAEQTRAARNIRAICILYFIIGLFAVLGGLGLTFDASGRIPQYVGSIVVIMGLAGIISAFGVLSRKSWGVPFCQVVSAVYLLSIPIGTILGAYFLLNIGKVKEDFR